MRQTQNTEPQGFNLSRFV